MLQVSCKIFQSPFEENTLRAFCKCNSMCTPSLMFTVCRYWRLAALQNTKGEYTTLISAWFQVSCNLEKAQQSNKNYGSLSSEQFLKKKCITLRILRQTILILREKENQTLLCLFYFLSVVRWKMYLKDGWYIKNIWVWVFSGNLLERIMLLNKILHK